MLSSRISLTYFFTKLLLLAALIISLPVNAQTTLPDALLFNGKPIDARCFAIQEGSERTVSLASCGLGAELDLTKLSENNKLIREDYFGYNFAVANAGPTQGYSYYRLITALPSNQYLIFTLNSSGGSGSFTALQTVERKGDTLKLVTLNTGDRCNGGLSQVKITENAVQYRVNITPFDFIVLANDNPNHLKAYDDLTSCAACCAGTVLHSRPLNHIVDESTQSIDFSHYVSEEADNPNETSYQRCFSRLIRSYQQKNRTVLNLDELKAFVHLFNQKCVTVG